MDGVKIDRGQCDMEWESLSTEDSEKARFSHVIKGDHTIIPALKLSPNKPFSILK